VPGRHEFGTGEINYANVLRAIDGLGYAGFVGLEFSPTGDSEAALAQVRRIAGV
jgi:hydroxypyruvate isomerase